MAGTMVIMGEDIMDITMGAVTKTDQVTTPITIRVDQTSTNNKMCLTIVTTISIAVMDNGYPAQCTPFFLEHALKFIPLYNYACNSIVIRLGIPDLFLSHYLELK